ncbi:MAG: phosphatase PAP2 family protein [Rubricoccaceae bacterium]|nr:phosphatase PAP2 family protein [Rubricoccaceae bacterium]
MPLSHRLRAASTRALGFITQLRGRREAGLILLLATLAGSAWVFLEIADAATTGQAEVVDEQILMLFREGEDPNDPIGSHSVESAVRDVTALGSLTVISLLTLLVLGYFFLDRRPRLALYMFVAVVGGAALSYALKFLYDRTRPSLVPPEALPGDPSFPSGHSAAAAVVYLTLALLLARRLPRRSLKVYVVVLGVLLTVAVGISRLYLGVHWPTDVLAGWTLGGGWALMCWQAERMLQRRGLVERSTFVRRPRPPIPKEERDGLRPPDDEPGDERASAAAPSAPQASRP